ncbi:MAG: enoyl-CoA hydratase/isomerase family protein [Cyanobacteria bacterium]|nr:enoyl-CoA hydratase/isomerase family protein [Cyanobacteriota bacterium]
MHTATVRLPIDLDAASMAKLTRELQAALDSPAPIVMLIGADADTYCLGMAIGSSSGGAATFAFSDLLSALHRSPKPLLTIVDGRAIGGGMGLACACDWVVATERATFALPELLWGLVPAIIWPVLTDRMAPHVVRQWTVSAHSRSATGAQAAGLVDDLVPHDHLDRGMSRGLRTLRRLDPAALQRLRSWARESRHDDLPAALRRGAAITGAMVGQPSVQRRWESFAAGESPWSD